MCKNKLLNLNSKIKKHLKKKIMSDKSRDLTATEAINQIKGMDKAGDIRKFAKGDSRKTVNDAVEKTIDGLKSKRSTKSSATVEKKIEKKKTPAR